MGRGDEEAERDLLENLTVEELRHIAYEQLGVRVPLTASPEEIHALLQYETHEIAENPVDVLRDRMIAFMARHEGRLSLPCSGDCYEHSDAVAIACYRELMRDTDGKID